MTHGQTMPATEELWIDRPDAPARIEAWLAAGQVTAAEAAQLQQFERDGYVVLRGAIAPEAVAALCEDIRHLHENPSHYVMRLQQQLSHPTMPVLPWRSRLLDFYVPNERARDMVLASPITRFFHLLYGEPAMAFQSLLFTWGSEQSMHKDPAFVVVQDRPCSLTASWIALEPVREGQGELLYYPGSHRDPLFLFGEGDMFWNPSLHGKGVHRRYTDYLHDQARAKGVQAQSFLAEPGDVLLWHPNLAHGGAAVQDEGKTRLSLVTHYCPASVKPRYFGLLDRDYRAAWRDGFYSSRHYRLHEGGYDLPRCGA